MGQPIFPTPLDDGCAPYRAIAKHLGCEEDLVHRAFAGLGSPEWELPTHLDQVNATSHALNEAARHAENLWNSLRRISHDEREALTIAGTPTLQQIEFLRDTLAGNASDLKIWAKRRNRNGGRNPASYIVSEGMRRLFRRTRKTITFGNSFDGGPSTEFGRAVEFALGAFGIRADWRRPTQDAAEHQSRISGRLFGWKRRKELAERKASPPTATDLTGIKIVAETENGKRVYVVSLTQHPDIPPLRVQQRNVPNGRDVTEYAQQWATSVRAALA